MFRKFNASEDIASKQNVKSSVQRAIRSKILETFPKLESCLDEIIPKKSQLTLIKWCLIYSSILIHYSREHISLLALENEILFFQRFDEAYIPSLKLVHRCESFPSQLSDSRPRWIRERAGGQRSNKICVTRR
jgi:malignant T-cell-amplified sequence